MAPTTRRQARPSRQIDVRERPIRPEVAEPAYPRSASKRSRLLPGDVHLVHAGPRLQRLEVSPVSFREAHVVLFLDRFEENCRAFQLLGAVGGHEGGVS